MILENGGKRRFVHVSKIKDEPRILAGGEPVIFDGVEPARKKDGDEEAIGVRRPHPRRLGTIVIGGDGGGQIEYRENGERRLVDFGKGAFAGRWKKRREPGDSVTFSLIKEGEKTYADNITRLDDGVLLAHYAICPNFNHRIRQLSEIAQEEPWDFDPAKLADLSVGEEELDQGDGAATDPENAILQNYIKYTFAQVAKEEKIATGVYPSGEKFACFNTGLVTRAYVDIYGIFNEPTGADKGRRWLLAGFQESSSAIFNRLETERPELATYISDANDLVFDTKLKLDYNWEHICGDHLTGPDARFPPGYTHLQVKQLISGQEDTLRKRLKRNYKTAIPQYSRDQISLLLPLSFDSGPRAHLALLATKERGPDGKAHYRASTVYTLRMAYQSARLLSRPDDEWLNVLKTK